MHAERHGKDALQRDREHFLAGGYVISLMMMISQVYSYANLLYVSNLQLCKVALCEGGG